MESKQKQIFEGDDSFWDLINGKNLFKANGSVHKSNVVLAGKKIILLYFSANWCQDCSEFTPVLANFYQYVAHRGIEIIFVSSDGSPEDMFKYMKDSHGDWYGVEYGSELAKDLTQKYDVWGIQCSSGLVVLSADDGKLITKYGRNSVSEKGPQAIYQWKNETDFREPYHNQSDNSDDDSDSDSEDECTFTQTGTSFRTQHWYYCHTCKFEYDEGVCSVCVKTCHANHNVSYAKYSQFFCDCGAKGKESCQSLSQEQTDTESDDDETDDNDINNDCDKMNKRNDVDKSCDKMNRINLKKSSKIKRKNKSAASKKDIMSIYNHEIISKSQETMPEIKDVASSDQESYYSLSSDNSDQEDSYSDNDFEKMTTSTQDIDTDYSDDEDGFESSVSNDSVISTIKPQTLTKNPENLTRKASNDLKCSPHNL